jgi:hypothetical protein
VSAAAAESQGVKWLGTRYIADDMSVTTAAVRWWIQTGRLIARGGTPGRYQVHPDDYADFKRSIQEEHARRLKRR